VRTELQRRIDQLSREIRDYPTPIARCDEQLSGLIEERARLLRQLNEFRETPGGCSPLGIWNNDGGAKP
jgi:chorismate mutase